jgi:NADPH-dependent 2,4-dienoyl-CoA reductase/sulfur reductase-like enzyme
MDSFSTEILVVGGGAAGMAAAVAASESASVAIIDDNPNLGGQIWRAELGRAKSPEARRLIAEITSGNLKVINNAQVYGSKDRQCLLAEFSGSSTEIQYQKLIIATGARELFLPFPGWTLPGVSGAGGLQALVKGGLEIKDKRILIAGTGPLLLAVADYLKAKGADIIAIAEQAPSSRINRFAFGLWRSPSKAVQGISLRSRLFGVQYLTDCWVISATGKDRLERVTISCEGERWSVECDFLACGYHLVPNIELADMLGCEIESGFVAVDELQCTSRENIYCAGEPTGIAGIESSLVEGMIAGLAAAGRRSEAQKLFRKRDKASKFGEALNRAFVLHPELRQLPEKNTVVCRCEDVEFGRLTEFDNFRDAKLQTRCGMGPCQGRICGAACGFLFGWKSPDVRPPIFPVKMENL